MKNAPHGGEDAGIDTAALLRRRASGISKEETVYDLA